MKKLTRVQTKTRLYETLVQSALLYNTETWLVTEEIGRKLHVFEMAVLRRTAEMGRWE